MCKWVINQHKNCYKYTLNSLGIYKHNMHLLPYFFITIYKTQHASLTTLYNTLAWKRRILQLPLKSLLFWCLLHPCYKFWYPFRVQHEMRCLYRVHVILQYFVSILFFEGGELTTILNAVTMLTVIRRYLHLKSSLFTPKLMCSPCCTVPEKKHFAVSHSHFVIESCRFVLFLCQYST